uniref:Uncharacterized protein n=1 Tax=Macrostomum lignano TaxID=282301 RepID=A0A1I8FCQ6_9PLAT
MQDNPAGGQSPAKRSRTITWPRPAGSAAVESATSRTICAPAAKWTAPGASTQREQFIIKLFDRLMDFGPFLDMSEGRTDGCPDLSYGQGLGGQFECLDQKSDTSQVGRPADHRSEEIGLHQGAVLDLPPLTTAYWTPASAYRPLLPSEDERLDIHRAPELAPAPEQLLVDHLDRWREVRRSWCSAMRAKRSALFDAMRVLNVCAAARRRSFVQCWRRCRWGCRVRTRFLNEFR